MNHLTEHKENARKRADETLGLVIANTESIKKGLQMLIENKDALNMTTLQAHNIRNAIQSLGGVEYFLSEKEIGRFFNG